MKSTRIGINSDLIGEELPAYDTEVARHWRALERVDVEPVILRKDMDPRRVVDELGLRGIVFSGGGDVSAARYAGDETLANDDVDPQRDAIEFALMEIAFERALPVLAVCRGMQVANVLLGGTLIEDLHHRLGAKYGLLHNQPYADDMEDTGLSASEHVHKITIASGTVVLREFSGMEPIPVNSFHHQAVNQIAPALHVTARADDGLIEAVEFAPGYAGTNGHRGFFAGVQWHPERLPGDRLSQLLYARFADACKDDV